MITIKSENTNLSIVREFRKGKEGINEIKRVLGWTPFLTNEARKWLNFMLLVFMRFRNGHEIGIDKFLFLDILNYLPSGFFIYFEMETFHELDLTNIFLYGANFKNCHFWRPNITNTTFCYCFFEGCDFTNGKIESVLFSETRVTKSAFLDCELRNNTFHECDLCLSTFNRSSVFRNNFEECDICCSAFANCNLFNTFFMECGMLNIEYGNCDLSLTKFSGNNVEKCSIVSCDITGAEIHDKYKYNIKVEHEYIPFCPMDNNPSLIRTFDEIEEGLADLIEIG